MTGRTHRGDGPGPSPRRARGRAAQARVAALILPILAPAALAGPAATLVAPAVAPAASVAPEQELAVLHAAHGVRRRPVVDAPFVASVAARRPITRARTALPVRGEVTDTRGRTWLHVRLPGRTLVRNLPRSGWISATHTRRATTPWHLVADLGARRVTVFHYGRRVRRLRAIVGAPATPTPRGAYFVEENVRLPADRVGAPFALATSARSPVLQEFDGGPGQIALHGLQNVGGTLGTAASHGCVRVADDAIAWLAARIAPGVPVTIRR